VWRALTDYWEFGEWFRVKLDGPFVPGQISRGRSVCAGRESLFHFDPRPIAGVKEYLDFVSEQWEQALIRLKSFVEK
jgi:hypothetical protein